MAPPERFYGQTRIRDQRGEVSKVVRSRFTLRFDSGGAKGRTETYDRALVRVGAAGDNDVILSDPFVSAHHAELETTDDGFVLRDLRSRNGTQVNGILIREVLLAPGARITVGDTQLTFGVAESYEVALGPQHAGGLVGGSVAMRECFAHLEKFARSDAAVLLLGETGVGKERFARALHDLSPRAQGPFEVFDCSAVAPELIQNELFGHVAGAFSGATSAQAGAFERAEGGTLLLDEIGELPITLQPVLLRVLESGELRRLGDTDMRRVNVRVVAATHRDLPAMVTAKQFRADLLYRLQSLVITIPPLRRRKDDLPALVHALLREIGSQATVEPEVMPLLMAYDWPGNLRELRNALVRATALAGDTVTAVDLVVGGNHQAPEVVDDEARYSYHRQKELWLEAFERSFLERILKATDGNVSRAAERAGLPRQTLHRLMAKYAKSNRPERG